MVIYLIQLLLKLAILVNVEVKIRLKFLNLLLLNIQVLVVCLSLSLKSLIHFHQVIIESYKLFHFGKCILSDLFVRLHFVLVKIVNSLKLIL